MAVPVLEPGRREGRRLERRPRQNYESWSWIFMRLTGLVLLFLALTHFAITHIVNDVVDTDAAFVGRRWSNPLWRVFDWALLALALSHGLNGLRWIVEDYVHGPGRRAATKTILYSLSLGLLAYGTFTIVTFSSP
ncbi:MAG TPA: succinate dehydrogenase hydrophobic membrane anchor subunit [Acidimicrobiales bacterium]|nr:succinate dehydrogenase hydrophobic membrane anchor subunit [Acidimicrobiales bacterium]